MLPQRPPPRFGRLAPFFVLSDGYRYRRKIIWVFQAYQHRSPLWYGARKYSVSWLPRAGIMWCIVNESNDDTRTGFIRSHVSEDMHRSLHHRWISLFRKVWFMCHNGTCITVWSWFVIPVSHVSPLSVYHNCQNPRAGNVQKVRDVSRSSLGRDTFVIAVRYMKCDTSNIFGCQVSRIYEIMWYIHDSLSMIHRA